ncbi:translocation/assembly module TamB domain-containing protein [Actinokineospora bangkokensis]|uniref:Oxidoreductase n=1 Tax=Actinokineospora bangkokensis TaxID=1193682 RepID=A0A1Q9LG35_9PSEU|nr:hypothetical protein [Actinokineospora bangkokensis]OLR90965.1 hypothetical protein BJP25_30925 [Actinokineospora bangkokensis]
MADDVRIGFDPHDPDPPASARLAAAEVVRRVTEQPDERGVLRRRRSTIPVVRIADRHVTGLLDLRGVESPYLLEFTRCRFDEAPDLRQARIAGVEFSGCALPGLRARNLTSDNDVRFAQRTAVRGTIDLTDAQVRGSLVLSGCRITADPGEPALHADRLQLVGALLAARLETTGEVRVPGLRCGGNVNLAGALLRNPTGFALNGNGLQTSGNLYLNADPAGTPFRAVGQVFLPSAKVDSDFSMRGAALSPRTEPVPQVVADDPFFDANATLVADRCRVEGNVNLDRGFASTGTVRIVNATVGGSLRFNHALVDLSGGHPQEELFTERVGGTRPGAPFPDRAVHLDGTQIRGGLDAREARFAGQVRLVDVTVQATALFDGSVLNNRDGDAVEGRRFTCGGNLNLRGVLVFGSVLLPGATVAANLDLRGSRLLRPGHFPDGTTKPLLDLRVARIGRDLICAADGPTPFAASGEIRARRAEVGRMANFAGAELGAGRTTVALNAFGVRTLELDVRVRSVPRGRIDLRYAECATLGDNGTFWRAEGGIDLEDFRYDALSTPIGLDDDAAVAERLSWMRAAMFGVYRPGPYDQFAAVLRASGTEELAARVLVEKQRLRYRALADGARLGPGVRLWSLLQRLMVGYGYRPARALAWLLVFLVLGSVWFGAHDAPEIANTDDQIHWNPVLYTLDLLVPIVDFGHKNKWAVAGASQWISASLIALGWVLATTVAAGVTRTLRRST